MPWTPFILITVLFGLICGNRLLEANNRYGANRYAAPAETSIDSSNPAESTSNSKNNRELEYSRSVAFKEDLPKRRIYGLERKLLKEMFGGLTESGPNEDGISAVSDSLALDAGSVPAVDNNSKTKRNLFFPNLRDLSESTETLSDIFAVDNATPTQLAKSIGALKTGGARNNNNNDFKSTMMTKDSQRDEIRLPTLPQLTSSYRDVDYYEDLLIDVKNAEKSEATVKRAGNSAAIGCDCKIKNDLVDLGQQHFPRYLLNAVCQTEESPNEYPQKCWRGSFCKPLEYKVKVLTFRTIVDHGQKDPALAWLPDDLRQLWKFKTVTVAAGCFCSY